MQTTKFKSSHKRTRFVDRLHVHALGQKFFGTLQYGSVTVPCRLGRTGRKMRKFEGDGATPIGNWPLLYGLYRPDRLSRPLSLLPFYPLHRNDGWCDDPTSPLYNQPIRFPFSSSAEHLWRDDCLYDIIIVLGHNDNPPITGLGSAVFFHLTHDDISPTQGCVALNLADMHRVLQCLAPNSQLRIY